MTISFMKCLWITVTAVALAGCTSTDAQNGAAFALQVTNDADIGFIAVGDTGYVSSGSGMVGVAQAVQKHCENELCSFALMAGDNIYQVGAAATAGDAELFHSRFVEPYGPLAALGDTFRIYAALGNHDWYTSRAGALAQVNFHEQNPPFYMDGLFYSVQPPAGKGDLEIFVIDTEMLLASRQIEKYAKSEDGKMIATGKTGNGGHENALPVTNAEKEQLAWLRSALAKSKAKWKIVLAHHPL